MKQLERILDVICIAVIVFIVIFSVWFIFAVKEMLNDYRCSQLPIQDFFQDKKCEKYWRHR